MCCSRSSSSPPLLTSDPSPQPQAGPCRISQWGVEAPMGCCGMTPELFSAAWLGPLPRKHKAWLPAPQSKGPREASKGQRAGAAGQASASAASEAPHLPSGLSPRALPRWAGQASPGYPPTLPPSPDCVTYTNGCTTHEALGRPQRPRASSQSFTAPSSVGRGWGAGREVRRPGAGGASWCRAQMRHRGRHWLS